jgi:hypothetical protein
MVMLGLLLPGPARPLYRQPALRGTWKSGASLYLRPVTDTLAEASQETYVILHRPEPRMTPCDVSMGRFIRDDHRAHHSKNSWLSSRRTGLTMNFPTLACVRQNAT